MHREDTCGWMMKQIHMELEKQANKNLRSHDLTLAQMNVLVTLDESEKKSMSFKELERILHVAQSTTAGMIRRLEQKGFVAGYGDAQDKRIKNVRITPEGEVICRRAEEDMQRAEEQLLSGLTPDERSILRMLLRRIRDGLQ